MDDQRKDGMDTEQEIERHVLRFQKSMLRIKANLERLGFTFEEPEEALREPDPRREEYLAFLEERVGALPLALKAFYRQIGGVRFTVLHDEWDCEGLDPVWVDPLEMMVEDWDEEFQEEWFREHGHFRLDIAPDPLHKDGASGGDAAYVKLPASGPDPVLVTDPADLYGGEVTFLEYLTLCVRWGGFPGLERNPRPFPLEEIKAGVEEI